MTEEIYFTIGLRVALVMIGLFNVTTLICIISWCKSFLFDESYYPPEILQNLFWVSEYGDISFDIGVSILVSMIIFLAFLAGWIILLPLAIIITVASILLFGGRSLIRLSARLKELEGKNEKKKLDNYINYYYCIFNVIQLYSPISTRR